MADETTKRGHFVRAVQSPMNAERWLLEFSCGHEYWTNAKRKPNPTKQLCAVPGCQ